MTKGEIVGRFKQAIINSDQYYHDIQLEDIFKQFEIAIERVGQEETQVTTKIADLRNKLSPIMNFIEIYERVLKKQDYTNYYFKKDFL